MNDQPIIPLGYRRRADGVLERYGGLSVVIDPGEAVLSVLMGVKRFRCHHPVHRAGTMRSLVPCGVTAKCDPDLNGNPTRCFIHSQATQTRLHSLPSAYQGRKANQ